MSALPAEPEFVVRLPGRPLTLAEVAVLSEADEFHRYELSEGNLSLMPPPDHVHNAIVMRLAVWLINAGAAPDRVYANSGIRIAGRTGRVPDLAVFHRPAPAATVWIDPDEVHLVVEVVSPGSALLDRAVKPAEYAGVGIAQFWRVDRSPDGPATVHQFVLGTGPDGGPAYVARRAVLLDDLLAEPAPAF